MDFFPFFSFLLLLIPAKISTETYIARIGKLNVSQKKMLTVDKHQQGEAYHHTAHRGKRSQAILEQASKHRAHTSNACPEVSTHQQFGLV
jgi:hypothetical protein